MVFLLILAYLVLIFTSANLAFIGVNILARPILAPKKRRSWMQIKKRASRLLRTVSITLFSLLFLHPLHGARLRSQHRAYFKNECRFDGFPKERQNEYYKDKEGLFSGDYVYEFNAPSSEIKAWVERSPVFDDATLEGINGRERYGIRPVRSLSCIIEIDYENERVSMTSTWS